mgnify:CR=1 FL=1
MPRRPTHNVFLVHKDTKVYTKIGDGWKSYDNISIRLNPGTVLDWKLSERYYINVTPAEFNRGASRESYSSDSTVPPEGGQVDCNEEREPF